MKIFCFLALSPLITNLCFAQKITCEYDDRARDGDMGKISLEKEGNYHKLSYHYAPSGFSDPNTDDKEIKLEIPRLQCSFSDQYLYVFECSSITEEGFRGKYGVYGTIALGAYREDSLNIEIVDGESGKVIENLFPILPRITEYMGDVEVDAKGCTGSSR